MEQIRQEQLMEWSSEGESEGTLRKKSLGLLFVSSVCERSKQVKALLMCQCI